MNRLRDAPLVVDRDDPKGVVVVLHRKGVLQNPGVVDVEPVLGEQEDVELECCS